jgi:DNA-binding MarR family transcriptional regulator
MSNSRTPAAQIASAWRRELPGVPTESIAIITPIWRIARVLAEDRRRTLARIGVDPSTLDLLSVIRRAGSPYELTTREIAERTLVTAGAISQRIATAEQAGLVTRSPSTASRRAVAVRLTDAGHELVESAVRDLLNHEDGVVARLSATERATLGRLLASLEATVVA